MIRNPLHRKLTPLERLLLELLSAVLFYADPHTEFCAKKWNHSPSSACTCKPGKYHIRANILLNKFNCGFSQWDVDKKWPIETRPTLRAVDKSGTGSSPQDLPEN